MLITDLTSKRIRVSVLIRRLGYRSFKKGRKLVRFDMANPPTYFYIYFLDTLMGEIGQRDEREHNTLHDHLFNY